MDRLVKAKSDGSLASTTTTATVTDASLNKMKSRSLEPLTGLAMWSSEPQIIELVKGERGLGFSILDYQVWKVFSWFVWIFFTLFSIGHLIICNIIRNILLIDILLNFIRLPPCFL